MRIREVGTGSGKKAIQVVSKRQGKVTVHKHIGSFGTDSERKALLERASRYIEESVGQSSLFDYLKSPRPQAIKITESRPLFAYELLSNIYDKIGFNQYPDELVKDLVIARVFHPTSKRETQEILLDLFGRDYPLITIYRHLKVALKSGIKEKFHEALVQFAKTELSDSLRLVFYDVTTLYFESTVKAGLRAPGFSKDNRPLETQIVVGLVVNQDGFPLYFDVFNGKTFEGHTFIPVIEKIRDFLGNPHFVVVADAAMISQDNIQKLVEKNIGFIVGARTANLPAVMIDSISERLLGQDKKVITLPYRDHRLICEYSSERASKDRSDRDKQLTKAELALSNQNRLKTRLKFIKTSGNSYSLNTELLKKSQKLEGIKSYLTNTSLPAQEVVARYRNLWKIEKAFRITKSDLQARPVFHRLDETIKAHLLIVFAGLAISKFIEIRTGMSIHKALKIAQKVLSHKVTNSMTGESDWISTTIEDPDLLLNINTLYSLGH
jgi:transposase